MTQRYIICSLSVNLPFKGRPYHMSLTAKGYFCMYVVSFKYTCIEYYTMSLTDKRNSALHIYRVFFNFLNM